MWQAERERGTALGERTEKQEIPQFLHPPLAERANEGLERDAEAGWVTGYSSFYASLKAWTGTISRQGWVNVKVTKYSSKR
jgi:hypothetical protein